MSAAQPWTLASEQSATLIQLVVELSEASTTEARDALLGPGIVELVPALVAASDAAVSVGSAVVVDIRCLGTDSGSARAWEAYLEAVRGLVQSFVLERTPPAAAINLVVSDVDQVADRDSTLRYLGSPDGGFSWGAGYDLREVTA